MLLVLSVSVMGNGLVVVVVDILFVSNLDLQKWIIRGKNLYLNGIFERKMDVSGMLEMSKVLCGV